MSEKKSILRKEMETPTKLKKKSKTTKKSTKIKEKDDKKLIETFKPVKKTITKSSSDISTEDKRRSNKYKVHDITNMEEILKQFDLDINYGPIIGISRSDRFRRAKYFKIPLMSKVKEILQDEKLMKKYPELDLNIWHDIDHHTYVATNKY